jgi:hypothetical protein
MSRAAWMIAAAAVVLAGAAGWIASSHPDGLERVAENLGFAGRGTAALSGSPFADYEATFLGTRRLAQAAAGVLGVALLYGFGVLFGRMLKRKR